MNLQRLKFAWARGAVIQRHCHVWADDMWECINPSSIKGELALGDVDIRIHPRDVWLEYGPLSSALRLMVIAGLPTAEGYMAMHWFAATDSEALGVWAPVLDENQMYWLFVAELLADEGL